MDIDQYMDFIRRYLDQYETVATQYQHPDSFSFDALRHARTTEWTRLLAFREKYRTATDEERVRINRILRGMSIIIDAAPDWDAQTSFLYDYAAMVISKAEKFLKGRE